MECEFKFIQIIYLYHIIVKSKIITFGARVIFGLVRISVLVWSSVSCAFGCSCDLRIRTQIFRVVCDTPLIFGDWIRCVSAIIIGRWTVSLCVVWYCEFLILINTIDNFRVVPITDCSIFILMEQMVGQVADVPHLNVCRTMIHLVYITWNLFLYFYWIYEIRLHCKKY